MLNLDRLIEAQRYFRQALSLAWNIGAASIALNSLHGLSTAIGRVAARHNQHWNWPISFCTTRTANSGRKDKAQQLSDQSAAKLAAREVAEALHRGQTRRSWTV